MRPALHALFLGGAVAATAAPAADAATLIGVLHHQPGGEAKRHLLRSIAARLRPGAPLVLAGNRLAYAEHPLLLAAWGERWRMHGAAPEEVRAKLGKIVQGADPPASEAEVAALLADAGFGPPTWFFSSLFWGACLARWIGSDPDDDAQLEELNDAFGDLVTEGRIERSDPTPAERSDGDAVDLDRIVMRYDKWRQSAIHRIVRHVNAWVD